MDIKVIGRGWYGWHTDGLDNGNRCSSSGGSLENYLKEAKNGTPVYDASETGNDFANFIVRGPMIDPCLPSGQISKFDAELKASLLGMLPGLEDGFQDLAVMAMADITSLDYVAIDVWLTMLRERVSGVKFGKIHNGQVEWE